MAYVKRNYEHNGIEIYFAEKPSDNILSELRYNKWNWHKIKKCWYTYYSDNNYRWANKICMEENQLTDICDFKIGDSVEFLTKYFGVQIGNIRTIDKMRKVSDISYMYKIPGIEDAVFPQTEFSVPWSNINKIIEIEEVESDSLKEDLLFKDPKDDVYKKYGLSIGDKVVWKNRFGYLESGKIAFVRSESDVVVSYIEVSNGRGISKLDSFDAYQLRKYIGFKKFEYNNLQRGKKLQISYNERVFKRLKSQTDGFSDVITTKNNNIFFNHQKAGCLLAKYYDKFAFFYEDGIGRTMMALDIINSKYQNDEAKFLIITSNERINKNWREIAQKYYPEMRLLSLEEGLDKNKKKLIIEQWRVPTKIKEYGTTINKNDKFVKFLAMLTWNEDLLNDEEDKIDIGEVAHHYIIDADFFKRNPEKYLRNLEIDGLIIDDSCILKNNKDSFTKKIIQIANQMDYAYLFSGNIAPESVLEYFSQLQIVDSDTFNMTYEQFLNDFEVGSDSKDKTLSKEAKEVLLKLISARSIIVTKKDCCYLPSDNNNKITCDIEVTEAEKEIEEVIERTYLYPNDLQKLNILINGLLNKFAKDHECPKIVKAIRARHCLDGDDTGRNKRTWEEVSGIVGKSKPWISEKYDFGIRRIRREYHDLLEYISSIYFYGVFPKKTDQIFDLLFELLSPPEPTQEEVEEIEFPLEKNAYRHIADGTDFNFKLAGEREEFIKIAAVNSYIDWSNFYLVLRIDAVGVRQKETLVFNEMIVFKNGNQKRYKWDKYEEYVVNAISFISLDLGELKFDLQQNDEIEIYLLIRSGRSKNNGVRLCFHTLLRDYSAVSLQTIYPDEESYDDIVAKNIEDIENESCDEGNENIEILAERDKTDNCFEEKKSVIEDNKKDSRDDIQSLCDSIEIKLKSISVSKVVSKVASNAETSSSKLTKNQEIDFENIVIVHEDVITVAPKYDSSILDIDIEGGYNFSLKANPGVINANPGRFYMTDITENNIDIVFAALSEISNRYSEVLDNIDRLCSRFGGERWNRNVGFKTAWLFWHNSCAYEQAKLLENLVWKDKPINYTSDSYGKWYSDFDCEDLRYYLSWRTQWIYGYEDKAAKPWFGKLFADELCNRIGGYTVNQTTEWLKELKAYKYVYLQQLESFYEQYNPSELNGMKTSKDYEADRIARLNRVNRGLRGIYDDDVFSLVCSNSCWKVNATGSFFSKCNCFDDYKNVVLKSLSKLDDLFVQNGLNFREYLVSDEEEWGPCITYTILGVPSREVSLRWKKKDPYLSEFVLKYAEMYFRQKVGYAFLTWPVKLTQYQKLIYPNGSKYNFLAEDEEILKRQKRYISLYPQIEEVIKKSMDEYFVEHKDKIDEYKCYFDP